MNGLIKKLSIILLVSFPFLPVVLAEPEHPGVVGQQSKALASGVSVFSQTLLAVENMTGEFTQSIFSADGELLQETHGDFSLKRPGYFLWHVAPPYEQVVIGSPDGLKVYDPDLEQMTVYAQNSLAGTPASLISGDVVEIEKKYRVEHKQNKHVDVFTLKSKNEKTEVFTALNFEFERSKTALPRLDKMSFTDPLGQKTEVVLKKQKINGRVDENVFLFIPPEGTDIIVDG